MFFFYPNQILLRFAKTFVKYLKRSIILRIISNIRYKTYVKYSYVFILEMCCLLIDKLMKEIKDMMEHFYWRNKPDWAHQEKLKSSKSDLYIRPACIFDYIIIHIPHLIIPVKSFIRESS